MIRNLQSIRFVFALMIFAHHYFTPQIAWLGTFPVSFFFILSGFVMTLGYENKVIKNLFDYKSFVKRRLIRIFPLNLFCLILYLTIPLTRDVVSHQFKMSSYFSIIPDALLVQSWIPLKSIYFSGNSVSWFLSSLLFCYLLFPFVIKRISSRFGKYYLLFVFLSYFTIIQFIEGDKIHALIYINPLFRVVDFIIGVSLCHYFDENKLKKIKIHETMIYSNNVGCRAILLQRLVFNRTGRTILELGAVTLCIVILWLSLYIPERYNYASLWWIPSVLLIVILVDSSRQYGFLSILLNRQSFFFLGSISFAFYMMHLIVISWYRSLFNYTENSVTGAAICILFTTFLASLYIKHIEPCVTKKLQQKYL